METWTIAETNLYNKFKNYLKMREMSKFKHFLKKKLIVHQKDLSSSVLLHLSKSYWITVDCLKDIQYLIGKELRDGIFTIEYSDSYILDIIQYKYHDFEYLKYIFRKWYENKNKSHNIENLLNLLDHYSIEIYFYVLNILLKIFYEYNLLTRNILRKVLKLSIKKINHKVLAYRKDISEKKQENYLSHQYYLYGLYNIYPFSRMYYITFTNKLLKNFNIGLNTLKFIQNKTKQTDLCNGMLYDDIWQIIELFIEKKKIISEIKKINSPITME